MCQKFYTEKTIFHKKNQNEVKIFTNDVNTWSNCKLINGVLSDHSTKRHGVIEEFHNDWRVGEKFEVNPRESKLSPTCEAG